MSIARIEDAAARFHRWARKCGGVAGDGAGSLESTPSRSSRYLVAFAQASVNSAMSILRGITALLGSKISDL